VEVGTPLQLFARPADAFAARLVGAPAIIFVPGRVLRRDGDDRLELPFGEIALAGDHGPLRAGDRVTVGVRPHDIAIAPVPGAGGFHAAIQLTEPLGDITVIDLDLRGQHLKMVLPEDRAQALEPGQEIEVVIRPEDLHLFDGESGRRIA
ncbi:MAG: TOBE domain-containing protein, partial [Geminicoccaceae bacterium]